MTPDHARLRSAGVRLGIHLPQYGRAASPDAIRDVAVRAEALGFADVWVSDHILQPAGQGYPSPYLFDALLTLGWAAAVTERVRLGTSVLVIPQYHPLQLANSLASLDRLSGGRVTVVGGVGWSSAEYAALDQDFATRGARMDESLALMRAVWTDDPASFHGRHYDVTDVRVLPQPVGAMPIWIGGASRGCAAPRRRGRRLPGHQHVAGGPRPGHRRAARRATGRRLHDLLPHRLGPAGHGPRRSSARSATPTPRPACSTSSPRPWRTSGADWIRSMELLVEIVHG